MTAKCSLSFLLNDNPSLDNPHHTYTYHHNNFPPQRLCGLPPASALLSLCIQPSSTDALRQQDDRPNTSSRRSTTHMIPAAPNTDRMCIDDREGKKDPSSSAAFNSMPLDPSASSCAQRTQEHLRSHQLPASIPSSSRGSSASSSSLSTSSEAQLQMLQALHRYLRPATDEELSLTKKRKWPTEEEKEDEERGTKNETRKRQEKKEKEAKETFEGDDSEKDDESNIDEGEGEDSNSFDDASSDRTTKTILIKEERSRKKQRTTKKNTKKTPNPDDEEEEGEEEEESKGGAPTQQHRRRATPFQAAYLEYAFRINPRPDATAKYHISQHINMSTQRVGIWFQNKRARMKKGKTSPLPFFGMPGSIVDPTVPPINHLGE